MKFLERVKNNAKYSGIAFSVYPPQASKISLKYGARYYVIYTEKGQMGKLAVCGVK
jgi:hypothetical protein